MYRLILEELTAQNKYHEYITGIIELGKAKSKPEVKLNMVIKKEPPRDCNGYRGFIVI